MKNQSSHVLLYSYLLFAQKIAYRENSMAKLPGILQGSNKNNISMAHPHRPDASPTNQHQKSSQQNSLIIREKSMVSQKQQNSYK